jgi:acyl carrier protein
MFTKENVYAQLKAIFIDLLDDETIDLNENTTANDIEGWDSLTHIQIVVRIEQFFKIKFTSRDIQSWKNIGELVDCIISKNEKN